MTKPLLKILLLLLSIFLLCNCSKDYSPRLQTKWQLRTTESIGQRHIVDTIFYNFDNFVFTIQKLTTPYTSENVYGEFHQKQDSLIISFPDPKYGGRDRLKTNFDWNDTIRRFKIVTLSQNELCLQDQYSILRFRKY